MTQPHILRPAPQAEELRQAQELHAKVVKSRALVFASPHSTWQDRHELDALLARVVKKIAELSGRKAG